MRLHHINCISSCPLGGALMDRRSTGLRGKLACHCIVIETDRGLVLLDTGFGLLDCARPTQRLSRFFLSLLDPDFREELTAIRQIEAMGYHAEDVRHIVLTHLDFDHAGGLDDFPEATVHMLHDEASDAVRQRSWLDRQRYRPQQWGSYDRWQTYDSTAGERWYGFSCVRDIPGLPPEVLMVPLVGHTMGHAGIAVREDSGRWLLLAGDAYFDQDEMHPSQPRCAPGLRAYQWMMEKDREQRLANQERLRQLVRDHAVEVQVVCSHDPRELERDTGHTLDTPILGAVQSGISAAYPAR
ncbi:MAG TPA: MBL fold metallo-hydrolase [Kofleriaceae bacterium]|nr:MBL fold metallo-hydrolase [Kofleriaceae bacterium]